jgi:hypothetical protein
MELRCAAALVGGSERRQGYGHRVSRCWGDSGEIEGGGLHTKSSHIPDLRHARRAVRQVRPIALRQGLRARADVAEYVQEQEGGIR